MFLNDRTRRLSLVFSLFIVVMMVSVTMAQNDLTYPVVDTNQSHCFNDTSAISCGSSFNGQDAQYNGLQPAYQDNGDGTVTDLNTGLMWWADSGSKMSFADAIASTSSVNFAGYTDWRIPTIKELYSLMDFTGLDVSGLTDVNSPMPFINDDVFVFQYGDTTAGERAIDAQWISSNVYVDTVMNNQECFFGVNFADGRIKCYPTASRGNGYFVYYVRGGTDYGVNNFVDNGNGVVTDNATGLTWMQNDNGAGVLWGDALNYCENLSLAGADDWRLPNVKELHSIVDYTRSPDTTNSAAIDPLFNSTQITNEAGNLDYGFYWSSTTHLNSGGMTSNAAYVSFGRALGNLDGNGWVDVHGAGAQRSDPKAGVPADEVDGHGPQGDARRAYNYVRCVRGGIATPSNGADPSTLDFPTVAGQQPPPQGENNQQPAGQNQPPQGGNGQQPPEEAFTACNGLAANASCSINTPNGTVAGTCRPINERLACTPNR